MFGAIASSGVTHATLELWEYMDVIRRAADSGCSRRLETSVAAIDDILLNRPRLRKPLKALFGLAGLEHDDDFAEVLSVSFCGLATRLVIDTKSLRAHWDLGKQRIGIPKLAATDSKNSAWRLPILSAGRAMNGRLHFLVVWKSLSPF